jgi:hypothetical protein
MEAVREFSYHGSCKNCHHLHTGYKLRLSSGGENYLPCRCEECDFYMFGVGISSPRSSLASLETVPGYNSSNGPTPRPSDNVMCCTDHLPTNTTEPQRPPLPSEDQASVGPMSTSRGRSLASSSQTRLSATDARPGRAASLAEEEPTPNHFHAVPDPRTANAEFNRGSSRNNRSSPFRSRFVATNAAKKLLEHLRRHMPWTKAPKFQQSSDHPETIQPTTKDTVVTTDPISPSTPNPIELSRPVDTAPPEEPRPAHILPTIALAPADTQRSELLAIPSHNARSDEANEVAWDPAAVKTERLRIQRRQLTLAKERLDQRVCWCGDECHCMGGGRGETVASTSHRYAGLSSLDLPNVPRHQLGHLLLGSETSSFRSQPPFRNPSPSRHVAFAGAHLETSNPPSQDLSIPSEADGDEQRYSRVSTSTGMTQPSQVTTAVNSSSSGSGGPRLQGRRMNSLPILTPRQLDRILDLLHVDRTRPETQAALRLLTLVSTPYPESFVSGQGTTRTNSMDVVPERHSVLLEGMNGRSSFLNDSTMSLSDLPEPGPAPPAPAAMVNGDHGAEVGESADITPQPMAPDQLSSELEELAQRPGN